MYVCMYVTYHSWELLERYNIDEWANLSQLEEPYSLSFVPLILFLVPHTLELFGIFIVCKWHWWSRVF